jgi:hypothetical protein
VSERGWKLQLGMERDEPRHYVVVPCEHRKVVVDVQDIDHALAELQDAAEIITFGDAECVRCGSHGRHANPRDCIASLREQVESLTSDYHRADHFGDEARHWLGVPSAEVRIVRRRGGKR